MNTKRITSMILGSALVASLLMGSMVFAATGTAPGQDKLLCFSGTTDGGTYGGVCTVSNGAKGPATLNNTDSNVNGDYSGVYIQNSTLNGQLLGNVTQLGYTYTGNITPTPGDLSLNLPIDKDGNGTADTGYAFIDAYYCPGVDGQVDVIHDPVCGIWLDGVEYTNWSALVAAHPTYAVATDALAFIVAERTPAEVSAFWTVNNVKLGKAGK